MAVPGTKTGQPLSHARPLVRLRAIGLGRARALLHLAARVEAPLLAQALGVTPGTAVRWSELVGRTYSGYVARTGASTADRSNPAKDRHQPRQPQPSSPADLR